VAKKTPWKKKLDDRIQTRESVVCKLRKKYMTENQKGGGQLDINPLIQSLSSFQNVETSRFLANCWELSGISQMMGGGASRNWCWLCPS
jgi:hypothetical protein